MMAFNKATAKYKPGNAPQDRAVTADPHGLKPPEGPNDSGMSETLGGSPSANRGHFGPGNEAAAKAESFKPGPRKTPDSTLEGASKTIRSETDDATFAHPEAEKDPRENTEV